MAHPLERVGSYRIHRRLGRGGMGEVWLASNTGLSRLEVIKTIEASRVDVAISKARFLREAFLMAQVNHPNVVVLYDVGDAPDGTLFLSMEYIPGCDLSRVIKRLSRAKRSLSHLLVNYIAQSIFEGLHGLHTCQYNGQPLQLVHRDISPHNIMVGFDGRVKVLDLGVAYAESIETLTKTGAVIGKPAYMSPEQTLGGNLDFRSDLFSTGAVIFEMLTGGRMFRGSYLSAMTAIANGDAAKFIRSDPRVPSEYRPLLLELMSVDLNHRTKDAAHAAQSFKRLIPSTENPVQELTQLLKTLFAKEISEAQQEVNSIVVTMPTPEPVKPSDTSADLSSLASQLNVHKSRKASHFLEAISLSATRPGQRKFRSIGGMGLVMLAMVSLWVGYGSRNGQDGEGTTPSPPPASVPAELARPRVNPRVSSPVAKPSPVSVSVKPSPSHAPLTSRKPGVTASPPSEKIKPQSSAKPQQSLIKDIRQVLRQKGLENAADTMEQRLRTLNLSRAKRSAIIQCINTARIAQTSTQLEQCIQKLQRALSSR